jgi:alpha-L-rhamnosidase
MNFLRFITGPIVLALSTISLSAFSLYDLTCEMESEPVGIATPNPRFSWKCNSPERGYIQSAYQIIVYDGESEIWNSSKVHSDRSILIPYSGKPLESCKEYSWKIRTWNNKGRCSGWSEPQTFTMGLLSDGDWGGAKWIALEKDRPEDYIFPGYHGYNDAKQHLGDKKNGAYKLPQFRRSFLIDKEVEHAYAFIAGLGQFDFFLNGNKVGDHFLDAGWTLFNKEAPYSSFDVTRLLQSGENVIGVMLGNGFYNIPNERYFKIVVSFGAPKMKMMLRVEYSDGTTETIISDDEWRVTESPIIFSSIYGGEDYDSAKEIPGWKNKGFNDKEWAKALLTEYPGKLVPLRSTPITLRAEIPAVRIFKNKKGWLYDLGQNFSGIVRIKLKSDQKGEIILRPGELLNPDSTVNQSASGSPYYFKYIADGRGSATWQPQFSYYGFRYVQVEGAVPSGKENLSGEPEIEYLCGIHTCNSAPEAGRFSCSKPMFNQIYSLIDWAMRSNMSSVLTDCPHREKLGWLEQAHLMQYSLQYRYDLSRMYEKIEHDMAVSQREDGCIPTIAPEYVRFANGFEDTPEWGSAFIISAWYAYRFYGDESSLRLYYPAMQRYIDYLSSRADNHIVAYGLGDWFDLGPENPGYAQLTSNGVTATSIYYYDVTIMSKIAGLLGLKDDESEYNKLAKEIKEAFTKKYFDKASLKIDRDSQTDNAMPLYVGLIDDDHRAQILNNLVNDIESRGNALTAGDIGYRYVIQSLQAGGRSDVIYKMNSRYDVPGYGWQLAHGATALTESWQAYGFVSNNHFMLGHLMEWFFSGLGGIGQTESSVGFRHIVINPQIVGDINEAETYYESPYGRIECRWQKSDESYILEVTIPANCNADVIIPYAVDLTEILDYGKRIIDEKEIETSISQQGTTICVGSGNYRFTVPLKSGA